MVKWMGSTPRTCDLCGQELKDKFIDGRTSNRQWGIMCVNCHEIQGCGLGTGKGQMYDLNTKEKVGG